MLKIPTEQPRVGAARTNLQVPLVELHRDPLPSLTLRRVQLLPGSWNFWARLTPARQLFSSLQEERSFPGQTNCGELGFLKDKKTSRLFLI
jgi:hypothetical protein